MYSCVSCGHVFFEPLCLKRVCAYGDVNCTPVSHWGCVQGHAYYVGVRLWFLCVIVCLHTRVCSDVLHNCDRGGTWCYWVLRIVATDLEAIPESTIRKTPAPAPNASYISRSEVSPFIPNNNAIFTLCLLI